MLTHRVEVDVSAGAEPKIVHMSQGDTDAKAVVSLYCTDGEFEIAQGTTAEFAGTRPDGIRASAQCLVDAANNALLFDIPAAMTECPGTGRYEAILRRGGKTLRTGNVLVVVEKKA